MNKIIQIISILVLLTGFLFSQSSVLDDYINNVDPYTEYSVVSSETGFGLPVMF